jgi:predicted NBD/HSP70 family sugar kinase
MPHEVFAWSYAGFLMISRETGCPGAGASGSARTSASKASRGRSATSRSTRPGSCLAAASGAAWTVAWGAALAVAWPTGEPARSRSLHVAGDARAARVWRDFADGLAQAVPLLAFGVDPEVIVIGGGVTEAGEPLLLAVVEALDACAVGSEKTDPGPGQLAFTARSTGAVEPPTPGS